MLLEPFNSPVDVLTKEKKNIKNDKQKALLAYAVGLIYKKHRIRLSSVHSIPLGLAQLSSIVKKEGLATEHIPFILDSTKRYINDEEIENRISSYDYDTVWMSVGSPEAAYETIRYAKIIKGINNDTPIMLGGVLPSMYPDFFLKNDEINFLIRGSAEIAVQQYIKNNSETNFSNIQGLCYRTNSGKINISQLFALEPDLQKIPPYDLEGLEIDAYMKNNRFCNLQTSRGCPYNCPFCSHAKFWGLKPKFRPINHVRMEMRILEDHGCKAGYLVDSAFTLNKTHMKKFVEAYEKEGLSIKLAFETRADHFSEEEAALATRMNTLLIAFGGESGSPRVLNQLRGKDHGDGHQHVKNMFKAVKSAKKYDILCSSTWVLGLPGENKETLKETKKVILELCAAGMDLADIRILQIFPGTDYFNNPKKWGLKIIEKEISNQENPWDKVAYHETEELNAKEIIIGAVDIRDALFQHYLSRSKRKHKQNKRKS